MRANQLRQVLRTYAKQWLCWVIVASWLGTQFTLLTWPSLRPAERLSHAMMTPLMGDLFLGIVMGAMLKLQFANPRARLLPGFAAAHLVVGGVIIGVAVAIKAALVSTWAGAGAQLALLSLTLVAIVAAVWIGYWMSVAGSYLLIVLIFAAVFAPQYGAGLIQVLSDRPIVSVGIMCVGLAALAALGARLRTLHEEMSEYSRQVPMRWDLASRAGNRDRRRWEAQVIARSPTQGWLRDAEFRLVLRDGAPMSTLRRLLLRQLAGGFSSLHVMPVLFTTMLFVVWFQSWSQESVDAGKVLVLSFFPMQMALGIVGGWWLRCWPYFAHESLRPLGRRDFVSDVAISRACDTAAAAGMHCAMLVVWLGFFSAQGPHGLLLRWVVLTMAQYVVGYCVMYWLVSFRRFWVLVLGTSGASFVSAALVTAALFTNGGFWPPGSLALAIIATALAVASLYRLAFRRWCRIDLD
ncbi:MAG: hypothetical protein NTW96_20225 [Planctomycetia bacterium]|nr:hypothetical protein [Planctomycetia bacterium]